jgi:hypothetical protein
MNYCKPYERAHLKKIKSLCQSMFAILEQCVCLSQAEELLDLAATLLGFNKDVDFVEGPEGRWSEW